MKEDYNNERHRGRAILLSAIAALLVGVGIFFYYSFFRQAKSELIEAVPTDAQFLYEVNDNSAFSRDIVPLLPYFSEMFAMDALPAFETVHNALPDGPYDITLSGHPQDNGIVLLFNTHIDKAAFKRLLRALSIDPANCETFEQQRIYTYGTNFKNLHFVFFNHILSISTNMELLKKSIIQHRHPKNLLSAADFRSLYDLAEKNRRQNWLFVSAAYIEGVSGTVAAESAEAIRAVAALSPWWAFQIRMSSHEVFLSGYTSSGDKMFQRLAGGNPGAPVPDHLLPCHCGQYYKLELSEGAVCHFSLPQDSTASHRFLIVRRDTTGSAYSPFPTSRHEEEMMAAYPGGIIPVTDSIALPPSSTLDTTRYTCFTRKGDSYLFATSESAISAYNQEMASNGNLAGNRYYKFAKGNIPSANLVEYTLLNPADTRHQPGAPGKCPKTLRDLRVLSASLNHLSDGYASVNLYLNFMK